MHRAVFSALLHPLSKQCRSRVFEIAFSRLSADLQEIVASPHLLQQPIIAIAASPTLSALAGGLRSPALLTVTKPRQLKRQASEADGTSESSLLQSLKHEVDAQAEDLGSGVEDGTTGDAPDQTDLVSTVFKLSTGGHTYASSSAEDEKETALALHTEECAAVLANDQSRSNHKLVDVVEPASEVATGADITQQLDSCDLDADVSTTTTSNATASHELMHEASLVSENPLTLSSPPEERESAFSGDVASSSRRLSSLRAHDSATLRSANSIDIETNSFRQNLLSMLSGRNETLSLLVCTLLRVAAEVSMSTIASEAPESGTALAANLERVLHSFVVWPSSLLQPQHELEARVREGLRVAAARAEEFRSKKRRSTRRSSEEGGEEDLGAGEPDDLEIAPVGVNATDSDTMTVDMFEAIREEIQADVASSRSKLQASIDAAEGQCKWAARLLSGRGCGSHSAGNASPEAHATTGLVAAAVIYEDVSGSSGSDDEDPVLQCPVIYALGSVLCDPTAHTLSAAQVRSSLLMISTLTPAPTPASALLLLLLQLVVGVS